VLNVDKITTVFTVSNVRQQFIVYNVVDAAILFMFTGFSFKRLCLCACACVCVLRFCLNIIIDSLLLYQQLQ